MYTLILENRITGCHGNHAFLHGPNRFIFGNHFFRIQGIPGNNLAPIKNLSWGARLVKLDAKEVESPVGYGWSMISGLMPKLMTQSTVPMENTELTICQCQQLNLPLVHANM